MFLMITSFASGTIDFLRCMQRLKQSHLAIFCEFVTFCPLYNCCYTHDACKYCGLTISPDACTLVFSLNYQTY